MKNKARTLLLLLIGVGLTAACAHVETIEITPDAVVKEFYAGYLEMVSDPTGEDFQNPLVNREYANYDALSPAFIVQVDELLASFEFGGYDPFLCAQNIPEAIQVDKVQTTKDTAEVTVSSSFGNHQFTVLMELREGNWVINDIQCQ